MIKTLVLVQHKNRVKKCVCLENQVKAQSNRRWKYSNISKNTKYWRKSTQVRFTRLLLGFYREKNTNVLIFQPGLTPAGSAGDQNSLTDSGDSEGFRLADKKVPTFMNNYDVCCMCE